MTFLVSAFVLALLSCGLVLHRNRQWHPKIMVSAFIVDVVLVLYIELNKHAINTSVEGIVDVAHHGLLVFHVFLALSTVLLYVALIVMGMQLLKGKESIRPIHRKTAFVFMAFRILVFFTSFWVTSWNTP